MPEMIEKEQDSQSDPDGVGDLKDGEISRGLSGHPGINVGEQIAYIHVVVECHNGKGSPEKSGEADKDDLSPIPQKSRGGFIFQRDDKGWLSDGADFKIWLFFLDRLDQIHDRHDIASRLIRGEICDGHHTQTV